jgi:hypothetical protein
MIRLIIILDTGIVERLYPKTIQGKELAVMFLKSKVKSGKVLGHKFTIEGSVSK